MIVMMMASTTSLNASSRPFPMSTLFAEPQSQGMSRTHPDAVAVESRRLTIQRPGESMYAQNYDPLGNVFLSTVMAAVPIAVLLYFIALHRHRDANGVVQLGIAAPYAAFYGVIAAFVIACVVFKMPV